MANDNRRRPLMAMIRSRHAEKPPEHEKHGGSILVLHPVIPVHIPLGLAGMTSAKIQILPGTPSENVSCSWRDPDHTYSCDHFFRTCMHFFPESCRSRRFAKGPGRGGRKKGKRRSCCCERSRFTDAQRSRGLHVGYR